MSNDLGYMARMSNIVGDITFLRRDVSVIDRPMLEERFLHTLDVIENYFLRPPQQRVRDELRFEKDFITDSELQEWRAHL